MLMITIYHNSRCKKSRAGLEYLSDKALKFEIKEYLKNDPFTFESLKTVLLILGKTPLDMIRKQEDYYKKSIKGKEYTDDELIELMVQNPQIIHRPIVINGTKGAWGDPAENISAII